MTNQIPWIIEVTRQLKKKREILRETWILTNGIPQIKNIFRNLNIQLPSYCPLCSYIISEYPISFATELNVWVLGGKCLITFVKKKKSTLFLSNMNLHKVLSKQTIKVLKQKSKRLQFYADRPGRQINTFPSCEALM